MSLMHAGTPSIPAGSARPHVVILVPNWNGRQDLERLLPNLYETDYEPFDVCVLDDGSTDDSLEVVRRRFPNVLLKPSPRNLGYAANCNRGFREAIRRGADVAALVTTDVELAPRWLAEAVAVLLDRPDAGVVGFDVLGYPYPSEYETFRREAAKRTAFEVDVVDRVVGCVLVFPVSVLRDLGLFDEPYVMYGEEMDLEARIRRAGLRVLRVSVPVYHRAEGSGQGRGGLRRGWYSIRNTMRYAIKNEPPLSAVRRVLHVANHACNPWVAVDRRIPAARRLRPGSAPINAVLIAGAVLWNLIFLPHTLVRRRIDGRKADAVRAKRGAAVTCG